jgi:hypothetical protein
VVAGGLSGTTFEDRVTIYVSHIYARHYSISSANATGCG